jgi:hypothetical protein
MTTNRMTIASDKLANETFRILNFHVPAAIVFGVMVYAPTVPPESCCAATTSVAETKELVTVKDATVADANAALAVVIVPDNLWSVTPVVLFVS